jgi:ElaB/YqjD/DUF883 family membrane-anchored ribosome-binding protein
MHHDHRHDRNECGDRNEGHESFAGSPGRAPLSSGAARDTAMGATGMTPTGRDPLVDRAANTAHQAVDRVASKVGPAVGRMRSAAQDSAQSLQTKLSDLDAMRMEWTESCRAYVRERPMTALGVAVLAGFLLSRWMRTS